MLCNLPVLGHACVIDRPGYDRRYRAKYGRQTWMLCQTAFTVLIERCAKLAIQDERRLPIFVERGDKSADAHIRGYYRSLLDVGMPFNKTRSGSYSPLGPKDFQSCLYGLNFKMKTSPVMQIADLYLYPIARGQYDPTYRPFRSLNDNRKLIDNALCAKDAEILGLKKSCFDT